MSKTALLDCPFCGGKAQLNGRKDPVVDCTECEAAAISVKAWNTRVVRFVLDCKGLQINGKVTI